MQEVHGLEQIVEYLHHLLDLKRRQLFRNNVHDFSEVTFHAVHHYKNVVELDPVFLEVGFLLVVEVAETILLNLVLLSLGIYDDVQNFGRISVFTGHTLLHF